MIQFTADTDKVKVSEVGDSSFSCDQSLNNPKSVGNSDFRIDSFNFNNHNSLVNNDFLHNSEFQIDEDNENQDARQLRCN